MPKYSLTNNGNVIQCKNNCQLKHEHFVGSYERALKYFGVSYKNDSNINNQPKSYGDLMNIVVYHQTSQYTIPKLSNELYDILIDAMAEHKYWVDPKDRHEKALEILDNSEKLGISGDEYDKKIIEKINISDNLKAKQRVYMYQKWMHDL